MTSKISCSKLFGRELRQLAWLMAVQAVVYLLLIPFRVLLSMSVLLSGDATAQDKLNTLCLQIGNDQPGNVLVILAAGVICGLCVFSYVHSTIKTDLYHSLSLKRETLFAVKYAAGAVTFVVPYAAAQALGLLAGAMYGAFTPMLIAEIAVCTLQQTLFFLCSYYGTILAVMMTGKMVTSVCAVAVLIGYCPMFWLLGVAYVQSFLNSSMQISSMTESATGSVLRCTSPWAFCFFWGSGPEVSQISYGLTGWWPSIAGLCQLISIVALTSVLALMLYRRRKSEAAGAALAFGKLEGLVKVLLAVPAALIAGLVGSELHSVIWEIVFIVLFASLACMVMEFIYRWDIHQVLQHKGHIAVSVVLASLIFFPFRYDIGGYNSYLPEKDALASMAVQGVDSTYTYPEVQKQEDEKEKSEEQKNLDYLECGQIDALYKLAENGVEFAQKTLLDDYSYDGETVAINLKYHLKNGKEVYRRYDVNRELYLETMEKLMQDDQYKERYYPILSMEPKEIYQMTAECYQENFPGLMRYYPVTISSSISYAEETETEKTEETKLEQLPEVQTQEETEKETAVPEEDEDYWSEITMWDGTNMDYGIQIQIPQANKAEFLEAYRKDMMTLTFTQIYNALNSLEVQLQENRQTYIFDRYPLNENFKNTARVLQKIAQGGEDGENFSVIYG